MKCKVSISIPLLCLAAVSAASKPQDNDNGQGKRAGWFGFAKKGPAGPSVQPTIVPGPGYAPDAVPGSGPQPASGYYGGPRDGIMATPEASRKSLYPGLSGNVRHSPRMYSPYDTGGPFIGTTPVFGETRGQYELRMKGMSGKQVEGMDPNTGARRSSPAYPEAGRQNVVSPGYPDVPVMENAPAQSRIHSRLSEIYADRANGTVPQPLDVSKVRVDFQKTHSTLERALEKGDYDAISREARSLQKRIDSIKDSSTDMPLQDRLNLMNMSHMAGEAAQSIFEGSSSQQDEMIRMGLQNLDKAAQGLSEPGPGKDNK